MITRSRPSWWSLTLAAVAGLFLSILGASPAAAGVRGYFVDSSGSWFIFDTTRPSAPGMTGLSGLNPGDHIVGLDYRPQNGMLYALGYNSGAGTVQLYLISTRVNFAAPIGATGTFVAGDGITPVPITGTNFGFDFNPTVDRIRVVNDAGQNFRMNPNTGAFVDGDLGGAPGSVPGVNMDAPISGATTSVDAAAYTNDEQNATATTLYTLSAATHTLYLQNPPNTGVQTTPLPVTLNGSPLNFTAANGFDILPGVNVSSSNTPATGTGLAFLTVAGTWALYTIDLSTGAATLLGIQGTGINIQAMALQGEPVAGGLPAIALGSSNTLARFNTVTPNTAVSVGVSGLVAGETLMAIDWRPQTGQLFGLGVNPGNGTGSATLYLLDPQTGAATIVGAAAGSIADGAGTPISLAGATAFGFDFNPMADRIRVVTDNGLNFRINPNDGTVVGGALDAPISGLPSGSSGVTGAAYTNNFGGPPGSGATTLYTLDPISNMLFIQNPPNNGVQTAGMPVTLNGSPLDFSAAAGFDIPPKVQVLTSNSVAMGAGYAMLTVGGISQLYSIELSNGAATLIGQIGVPGTFSGLAVGDGAIIPTTVTLSSSPNPSIPGQTVTFTATIAPSNLLSGDVRFRAGGTVMSGCETQFVTLGTATCMTSLPAGSYNVVADFTGDQGHTGSVSAPLTQTVSVPPTTPTTITLQIGGNPAQEGQNVVLQAVVTPSPTAGTVTFFIDGVPVSLPVALPPNPAQANVPTHAVGTYQVTAQYSGDAATHLEPSTSAPVTLTVVEPGPHTQYFAEGATGGFFQTDVGLLNASKTARANVTATLYPESGSPVVQTFTLAPLTRRTIDVNTALGSGQGVSTLIQSDTPVAATRQMTWGHPVYGSTLESGIEAPSLTWYFAEGATNVFSLFYQIENSNATQATVTLTHLLEGGAAPVIEHEMVPAFSRRTFYINDVPGLRYAALSTIITSDVPVVAERAMYLNSPARVFEGGTAGRGATWPSSTWYFAEGSTGFFHTYLLLGNPNMDTATVTVRYQLPHGTSITKSYDVPGQSRRTIDVNGEDPQLASTAVAMEVSSFLGIVAERAVWWGDPFYEGTVALGSPAAGRTWAIGEGAEGGPDAEATFVLISSLGGPTGTVRLTVVYDDGTNEQKDYTLLGGARLTVRVGDDFAKSRGQKFSVLVESLYQSVLSSAYGLINVEIARYQSPTSFLDGGGAASATKIK
jgi:hypothetical protein